MVEESLTCGPFVSRQKEAVKTRISGLKKISKFQPMVDRVVFF